MELFDRGSDGEGGDDGDDGLEFSPPPVDDETTEAERQAEAVEQLSELIPAASDAADDLADIVDDRTVEVNEELDEDAFFSTVEGHTTVTNRYDLEKAVPLPKKPHFVEKERYWVNKPHSFIVIFHSERENETKYYAIEPHLNEIEQNLREFLSKKLRTAIKYQNEDVLVEDGADKAAVIERETRRLLERYDLYEDDSGGLLGAFGGIFGSSNGHDETEADADDEEEADSGGLFARFRGSSKNGEDEPAEGNEAEEREEAEPAEETTEEPEAAADDEDEDGGFLLDPTQIFSRQKDWDGDGETEETDKPLEGISVRPEPAVIEENAESLNEYQVQKILYYLKRDFVGYERIDAIKHDINVEDISCDGYNSPVFAYHTDYEQLISNIYHGQEELDDFVVKLAQRSGKGISKRQPQVDATLPDGSRAQLTLGREVSDHGTNYTIRQFKDVPFTPTDLINWRTFSLDQMAFLWLAIENHKSLIFAGGTASGKTTSLNAVSLFIPSNAKIVSIEDTREVELPQRNWIASVTRPSFSDDEKGDVDEFDLLEAALRQRPDYIVMGEIRGEEGRTLFQVMSTGHTTYTTFHADSVGEVLKRFTTEPINVSKTLFTALDLVSIQTQTRVRGRKVRKSKSITEINEYSAENDEINVQDVYQWRAETDEFEEVGRSNVLQQIMFDRGWDPEQLTEELFQRRVVLAYMIQNGLKEYAQVAATIQAFISDPDTVLRLVATDTLEERLADLRDMESVEIDIDQEKENLVPRPDPDEEMLEQTGQILQEAEDRLFDQYRQEPTTGELEQALKATAEPVPSDDSSDGAEGLFDTSEDPFSGTDPFAEADPFGESEDDEVFADDGGTETVEPADDEPDEELKDADFLDELGGG